MSLYVETQGSGAPLVLLHGWGMHGGMWQPLAQRLAQGFQVHSVDLPGHGYSTVNGEGGLQTLDGIVAELAAQFCGTLTVCGWSMGGQIALSWARLYPQQVQRLVLVASTPCFVEREDWSFGMAQDTLQHFAAELEQNHAATLRRFLALQLRGSENERGLLQQSREQLFARGEPDMEALRSGLGILRDTDLRAVLHDILQPTLLIFGERDLITPPAAAKYIAQALPRGSMVSIKGAAHAPFLSHLEIFIEQMLDFLHE